MTGEISPSVVDQSQRARDDDVQDSDGRNHAHPDISEPHHHEQQQQQQQQQKLQKQQSTPSDSRAEASAHLVRRLTAEQSFVSISLPP